MHRIVLWVAATVTFSGCYAERDLLDGTDDPANETPVVDGVAGSAAREPTASNDPPPEGMHAARPIDGDGTTPRVTPTPSVMTTAQPADPCRRPLEEYCASGRECAATLSDARSVLCPVRFHNWRTRLNVCSGVNIIADGGLGGVEFTYDATGKLVGAHYWGDLPWGVCARAEYDYGTFCKGVGSDAPLCPSDDLDGGVL